MPPNGFFMAISRYLLILFLILEPFVVWIGFSSQKLPASQSIYLPLIIRSNQSSKLSITSITDNRADFPTNQAQKFEKFEITFRIENSLAQNPQFPYDPLPPPGIDLSYPSYQGITVNAVFTPDNWLTTYVQPAFYYQEFLDEIRDGNEWYYPTGNYSWKVRFSPDRTGTWQYKLTAQDASGFAESASISFDVIDSSNPGFVQVSSTDPRYFEFENGKYFTGLGYNLNYNQVDWINPTLNNQENFQIMSENEIQLVRIWLSQWGIFTSAWNPWNSPDPSIHGSYIPGTGLSVDETYYPNELSMVLRWETQWFSPCMFIGSWKARPAIKPYSDYRVRVRYKAKGLAGPRQPNQPFGFAVKTGNWLWGSNYCYDPGVGDILAATYSGQNWQVYTDPSDPSWNILESTYNSGSRNFLPNFYLALENVTSGEVYVDSVYIEEILGGGVFGPNIVSKSRMDHHLYFEQRNSYAFDKLLDLADQYDIYLRPVILEKNEWIFNRIQPDGSIDDSKPSNNNFYGEWRDVSKSRWLMQAWWRYLQARWGYSTNIHSWELINEGDPANTRNYALTDEFGKYMHCRVFDISVDREAAQNCVFDHPNAHLVSTSFWHSFPTWNFWGSSDYPNIDYADVHAYVSTGWLNDPIHESDSAAYHLDYGKDVREKMDAVPGEQSGKPIIRGEAGIDFIDQQIEQPGLQLDNSGVWLHNYIWASLDSNALLEEYWWNTNLKNKPGPDGNPGLYEIFRYYHDFVEDIPLNNGHYMNANASASDSKMRVVGQKDTSNGRAHLWVSNKSHTWKNVVNNTSNISGLTGIIMLDGFTPNTTYSVEWHIFTTHGVPSIEHSTIAANSSGVIELSLPSDSQITDVGIKIYN